MYAIFRALIAVALAFLVSGAASGQVWQTVYQTDFSTDPGWVTNNSSLLHWDAAEESYYANQINVNYAGNYAYYDVGHDGSSFRLEWDILVSSSQYASGLTFGIFDHDLNTNNSESYATVTFVRNDQGHVLGMKWCGASQVNPQSVWENSSQWSLNTWYQVSLEYDSSSSTMTVSVTDRATGNPYCFLTASGVGPFDSDMGLIGNSNVRDGTYQVPGAQFTGRFDNVTFSLAASYPNQIVTTIECNTDVPYYLGNVSGLCLNSDDSRLYAAYWQCPDGSKVEEYDLSDFSLIQSIPFGSCHGDVVISSDNRYLFSQNYYYSNVSKIDLLDGNAEETQIVGPWPADIDITPDKSKILVKVGMDGNPSDYDNDQITIIDVASYTVLAEVPLSDEPAWHKIGFSSDSRTAYVTANRRKSASAMLYEISLEAPYGIARTLPIPGNANPDWDRIGIAVTDSKLYVGDYINDQILVVDLAMFAVVDSIPLSRTPGVISLTPDGVYLFVLDSPSMGSLGNTVSVIEVTSESVVEQIPLDYALARDIEFSQDGSRAYISHFQNPTGAITVLGLPGAYVYGPIRDACCCISPTLGDCDQSGEVDITDISVLVDNQFLTLTPLVCEQEGDIDVNGVVDITDLTILIDNQFLTLTPLPPCP